MNGVAIDWVTKYVYWTDGQYKEIGVLPSATRYRVWKAIVDKNLSSPQDIAVNPVLRQVSLLTFCCLLGHNFANKLLQS